MPEQEPYKVGDIISAKVDVAGLPAGSRYKVVGIREDKYDGEHVTDIIYALQRVDGSVMRISWDLIKEKTQKAAGPA